MAKQVKGVKVVKVKRVKARIVKEIARSLVPIVSPAEQKESEGRRALTDQLLKQVPQLFAESQRRLVLNETPKYVIKKRKGKAGLYFDYVDIGYVLEQLNLLTGFRWDFEVLWQPSIDEAIRVGQYLVRGELRIFGPKGIVVKKQGYGKADLKYERTKEGEAAKFLDFGNDMKAAESDCIKKCASLFGVALDVYSGAVKRVQDETDPHGPITEGQRRRLEVVANEAGIGHSGLKRVVAEMFDYTSTTDIQRRHLDPIMEALQRIGSNRTMDELNIPDDIKQGFDILDVPPAKRIATFRAYSEKGDGGIKELRAKLSAEVDKRQAKKEAVPAATGAGELA